MSKIIKNNKEFPEIDNDTLVRDSTTNKIKTKIHIYTDSLEPTSDLGEEGDIFIKYVVTN